MLVDKSTATAADAKQSLKRKSPSSDFIMTIDNDDDYQGDDDDDEELSGDEEKFADEGFVFEESVETQLPWDFAPTIEKMKKQTHKSSEGATTLEDKIKQRLNAKKLKDVQKNKTKVEEKVEEEEEEEDEEDNEEDEENEEEQDNEEDEEEEEEEEEEKQTKKQKLDKPATPTTTGDKIKVLESNRKSKKIVEEELPTFEELHLSRPLLKAIQKLGFTEPTPIQAKTIPLAMNGKDILASASTGSGKTAAFLLPILERLLFRDSEYRAIRVLVLLPTRELALQCQSVMEKLAQFSNITSCLVVGGLSNKAQEVELRKRPDVVIATPGRMIDHLLNAHGVGLDDLEILILDEADRLLDMGFKDEIGKIVDSCPSNRQTMLFSATLNDEVKTLAKLSLKQPIRVQVDALMQVASTLDQEFVKIKPQHLSDRPAILLSLCTRVFNQGGTIIFCRSKKEVHRLRIIFGLSGLKAAELHGNLSQEQRFTSLQEFRDASVNYLLASDVASRGLDIIGVKTVINYNMPHTMAQYIHRVGRTARAGMEGKSCSLVTENDRKLLKEIVTKARNKAKSRSVSQDNINYWRNKIEELTDDIKSIVRDEMKEADLRKAEKGIDKAESILTKSKDENLAMEKVWFKTKQEEAKSKELWKIENNIINPKLLKAPINATGSATSEPSLRSIKKSKDPYYGLSRKQKRKKQFKEEYERDLKEHKEMKRKAIENGEDFEDDGLDENDDFKKVFSREQNSQRSSGKSTKRIEQMRRNGLKSGLTDREKQKIDRKKAKKAKKNTNK
ncbi:hypothetical protein CYY_004222 [Polysphondylium violaceum]|uniref:RNA helicase n=1 Tax=Polysphondylium violaceum TaxID=133409 RepID=A0A8J4V5G1_9MYCE|nr:hypothetical protein CYY_004222 [Polysphondylium violaceum]